MSTADRFWADRSLMRRDPADPGRDLAVRDQADPGRDLAVQDQADPGRAMDREDPAEQDLVGRRTDRGDLGGPDRVDRVEPDLADRADPVEPDLADPVEPDLADRADPVEPDPADREDLAGQANRVEQGRGALTIGAMPRWVAPWMRLAASAHATTARHLHRVTEDSAGAMGVRPVGRRLTGSARRLRGVGTVLRRPVVGTTRGTDRTAASSRRKATSGRAITGAIPPFRSSVLISADGAFGSSAFGFRCTDAT